MSYADRVVFNRLTSASPVPPEVVCQELGETDGDCRARFDRLVAAGLARRWVFGLYASNLVDLSPLRMPLRVALKTLKLMLFRKPIAKTSAFVWVRAHVYRPRSTPSPTSIDHRRDAPAGNAADMIVRPLPDEPLKIQKSH
jgi:hypothetical protein